LTKNIAFQISGLEMGRYAHPTICSCSGKRRQIAFLKTGGDILTGDIVATANPGIYIGDITLPEYESSNHDDVPITNIRHIPTSVSVRGLSSMRFLNGNSKLLVQLSGSSFLVDVTRTGTNPDRIGMYNTTLVSFGTTAHELARSSPTSRYIAFVDFMNVYVVEAKNLHHEGQGVWSKPGNATKGLARVSLDGGHDIRWDAKGDTLFWFLGPYLHSLEVSKLSQCNKEIERDDVRFGVDCVKGILGVQKIKVSYATDISRLRQHAQARFAGLSGDEMNADVLVITNATLLTMDSGSNQSRDTLSDAVLLVRGGLIEEIGSMKEMNIPLGSTVIDAQGG